jgi:hypothetical protein
MVAKAKKGESTKFVTVFWTNMFPGHVDPRGPEHPFYISPVGTRDYEEMVKAGCHTYMEFCNKKKAANKPKSTRQSSSGGAKIGEKLQNTAKKCLESLEGQFQILSDKIMKKSSHKVSEPKPALKRKLSLENVQPQAKRSRGPRDAALLQPHNLIHRYPDVKRPYFDRGESWTAYITEQHKLSSTKLSLKEVAKQEVFFIENIIEDNDKKLDTKVGY